jgi:hypothetical protein
VLSSDSSGRAPDAQSGRQDRRSVAAGEPILQGSGTLCAEFVSVSTTTTDSQLPALEFCMNVLILFVGWCILLVLAWPVALMALVLLPFVWFISLLFRVIGVVLTALFALLRAILFLPARMLGYRG